MLTELFDLGYRLHNSGDNSVVMIHRGKLDPALVGRLDEIFAKYGFKRRPKDNWHHDPQWDHTIEIRSPSRKKHINALRLPKGAIFIGTHFLEIDRIEEWNRIDKT